MSIVHKIKLINKEQKKESFYCTLCHYPHLTGDDFIFAEKYNTCHECYQQFIEGNKEEWKNGVRPSKTVLRDYILLKNKLNSKEIK